MSKRIDILKFVASVVKVMKTLNLNDLSQETLSRSNSDSVWYHIAHEYHGDLSDEEPKNLYNKAYSLYTFWSRNSQNAKVLIKESVENGSFEKNQSDTNQQVNVQTEAIQQELQFDINNYSLENSDDVENIKIDLEPSDWNLFSSLISISSNKQRIWLRRGFGRFLSRKLHDEAGIHCWLQAKHNHFNLQTSKSKPHWKGSFKYTEKGCKNIFRAEIQHI